MRLSPRPLRASSLAVLGLLALATPLFAAESLLVKNALLITMKPGEGDPFIGYMSVGADGRIAAIAPGEPPATLKADRILDAGGKFVAPGFVSSHSHLADSPLRGIGHNQELNDWGRTRQQFLQYTTADDIYWFVFHGALDYLRSGITTAYDFEAGGTVQLRVPSGQVTPPPIIKAGPFSEAQIRGKADAGLRFVPSIALPAVGTDDEIVERFDKVYRWAKEKYADNPLFIKMGISGQLGRAPSKQTAFLEARIMKAYGIVNQTHLLESSFTAGEQQPKFYWYEEAGVLGPDLIFGHFIHTTPDIVARAGKAGSSMSWQPWPNGRLADGAADIPLYRAFGLKIGIGLDNPNSADTSDPFTNLRVGIVLIRSRYKDAKALSVRDVLHMHTLGSAQVLRIDNLVGSLEPGKFADFVVVDPADPDTGPLHEPLATYVLACGQRNLKQVYVGGKLTADGTKIMSADESIVRKEAYARVARIKGLIAAQTKAIADAGIGPAPHPFAQPLVAR